MPFAMATSQSLAAVEGTGQTKERIKDDGTDVKVEPTEHIERGENGREELRERERIRFVCWYALSDWPVSSIVLQSLASLAFIGGSCLYVCKRREWREVVWKVYPNLFPMESVMGETTEGSKEETPSCEPSIVHDYSDKSTLGHVIANAAIKGTSQGNTA
ncbi:unnamed protein product [Timema podura]|uniref:Uncharacterized protein n=1 Tax=Timema podura TaxID=61482 RepID=A0ABN7NFW0_TIMPD|nr:unnamed protein product [Timema podura]